MDEPIRVVAAALMHSGEVLAARRTGRGWEFPGGKVVAGETDEDALRRELAEELSVQVEIGAWLDTTHGEGVEIRLYEVGLVGRRPRSSTDHDELRWVDARGLGELDWLPLDVRFLEAVAALLPVED